MYQQACLCLKTGEGREADDSVALGRGPGNPFQFSPRGMCYFYNLTNQFGAGWVLGWDEALILLPTEGVVFGGLTWQGPSGAAGRKPGSQAGALESAPPRAPGGQEWAKRGSLGPAAWAPFLRVVLGALSSREQETKDDMAELRGRSQGHRGPDLRGQHD